MVLIKLYLSAKLGIMGKTIVKHCNTIVLPSSYKVLLKLILSLCRELVKYADAVLKLLPAAAIPTLKP